MSNGEGRSCGKCLACFAVFVVLLATIITVLSLTVMKIHSPKVRFNAMVVESFSSNNTTATSINMRLLTQVAIKNTNFGYFKYDNSTLIILYNGVPLGKAVIPPGRANARETQKFNTVVDVSTDRVSDSKLGNEINSGVLKLSSETKLNGMVHLMKVIKKKKSGEMKCDWTVNLGTRQVEGLRCN
ncbi:hypothetical protein C2S53_004151 [Perilla frutescens var. hirtella]|uniref:Late embryogenesis abundant protein LEA-2 subgroup domain-containing protein n=1 Tax=Perilla frutescens var. hirtella TaxID=608512 RepID=A0AAD4P7P8_PERFH|nr:hypothetical protein C2S53_004151 [Perilla frutescens var. hirtella]